jgi:metal-responsive CopG/Arc/MetJ family transcriptional regulator
MARVNLTLDDDTYAQLDQHAKRLGKPRARAVKDLLIEGLARHATHERRQRLARDYAAGRADAHALLNDLESGQFDLLDDERS